jgi:hypothetical protein
MLIVRVGPSYEYDQNMSAVNGEEDVLESVSLPYRFPFNQKVALRGLHIFKKKSVKLCFVFCSLLTQSLYRTSIRTSQETHYVSATETTRLMLFGETVAVYCENHTEHINTLCGQNAETLCIRIQSVPHRKLITSPLQRPTG